MPFTAAQQAAIDARNPLLLVSAAAGSGKTAVLVERVLSLIQQDGVSVSRMLIVTFTRAAAAEMRDRLQQRLAEQGDTDARLRREAALVETAQISTIHAFCHALVQEFFPLVDVDPEAQLMQPARRQELLDAALEDVVTQSYESPSADTRLLQQNFSDQQILGMLSSLYDFLLARPDPFSWLHGFAAKRFTAADLTEGALGRELLSGARLLLMGAKGFMDEALRLLDDPYLHDKYKEDIRSDERYIASLLEAAHSGPTLLAAAKAGGFKTMSRVKLTAEDEMASKARFSALRDEYKQLAKDAAALFPADAEKAARDLEAMQPCLRALEGLCLALHARFQQDKREAGLLDFGDVEHMALEILRHPVAGPQVAARYDALFVDESQDVSGLQEALLSALYGRVRTSFLVGDVKQSIYRFRLAEPSLFLAKLASFSDEDAAEKRRILLNRNFRSRENVLASTNYVFSRVMRRESTEIEYDDGAALWPGLPSIGDLPTELHVLPAAPAARQAEREALLAAERIRAIVGTEKRTRDGKPDGMYAYRDIAILLPRAKGVADVVERVLSDRGIPTQVDGGAGTLDTPEIGQTLSCLRLLDNAMDDLSLLSALRGPMFELTDAELCDIRLCAPEKGVTFYDALARCAAGDTALARRARGVLDRLADERFRLQSASLGMYLWDFLHRSGLYAFYGAQSGGRERQRNLRLLCAMADAAEKERLCSLHDFLREAQTAFLGGDSRAPSVVSPWEDVVRVMTIHKSKGLEFPVVLGLGQSLAGRDKPTALRTHAQLGVALKYVSRRAGTTRETALTRAIHDQRVSEEVSERARLLYVAMTRARDQLLLFGHLTRKRQWEEWRLPNTPYRVRAGKSMLDWLGQTVCDAHGEVFSGENSEDGILHSELWKSDLDEDLCTVSTGFPQKTPLWRVLFHSELQNVEKLRRGKATSSTWQEGLLRRAEELRRARAKQGQAAADAQAPQDAASLTADQAERPRAATQLLVPGGEQDGGDRMRPLCTPALAPLKLGVTALCRQLAAKDEAALAALHREPSNIKEETRSPAATEGMAAVNGLPQDAPSATLYAAAPTDPEETELDKRRPAPPPRARLLDDEPARPAYRGQAVAEATGAERGEATHKALSLLRLDTLALRADRLRAGAAQPDNACTHEDASAAATLAFVQAELRALESRGQLAAGERRLVSDRQLAAFLDSPLGRRMLHSSDVRREWSFNARFPALCEAVVQGVIDLCFVEDGAWVLVDYKTDRVSAAAELLPRYGRQVALYRQALREITRMPVKEAWLYSLRLGEAAAVPGGDVSRETKR